MTTQSLRVAIYLRISKDKTGEAAGVDRQREDCLALVAGLGWTVFEVYVDNDTTASDRKKPRRGYLQMLKDIRAGSIDAVVAWHPDRLYRRLADLEDLIEAIDRNNVIMRTVRAGEIDLSTPTGRMLARILSATAQAEVEVKADRWARSWQQGRERGQVPGTGTRLFGYTRDGEVIEHEKAIAVQLAEDIIAGVPLMEVSRQLEAQGILSTRNGVWRPAAIRQYLCNPRIAGYSTLRGEIVAEGQWEPLLDRDTWETVRALIQSRGRSNRPRVSLLNGLLFCGAPGCGYRMITSGSRAVRTYRCPNRPGMPGCGRVSGNAEPIEEIVEAYARTRLDDPRVRTALRELSHVGAPAALAEITNLEARILELDDQLDQPGVPVETLLRARSKAKERLEQAQRALEASTPAVLPPVGSEWPTDLERRARRVSLVVGKVYLDPATQRIRAFDENRVRIVPAEAQPRA